MNIIQTFAERAEKYMAALPDQPVYPSPAAIKNLEKFDTPLQAGPRPEAEVLALLDETGSPATVKTTAGRYYGFITGGSLPAALSAKLLATVWDQNAALTVMSPVASKLETVAGRWLLNLFGLPAESGFGFVTGDTMANFTALAAARHRLLKEAGWNVEAEGLFGAPEITVVVGDEVHVSVFKALSLLGFGKNRVIRIPVDAQGRMRADKIPSIKTPAIICTQAGNVNTGAFDPLEEICAYRKEGSVWVHVDGAFGLWATACSEKKYLSHGIGLADSWATDAHKWLNVPYDSGMVFVRDQASLFAAMTSTAAYLPSGAQREPMHYVPEMSRQARAIPVWAALKSLGTQGVSDLVERSCRQAKRFAAVLQEAGFTILNEVVLNQVLVSFGTPEHTLQVIRQVQQEGVCWCGGTSWQGKTAMRISVSSWATSEEDVERSLQSIIKQAKIISPV